MTESVRITFELLKTELERIYNVLDDLGGISRSAFIRQAIREKLDRINRGEKISDNSPAA